MDSQKIKSLSSQNKKALLKNFNYSHIKEAKKGNRFSKLLATEIYKILKDEYNNKITIIQKESKLKNELKNNIKNEKLHNEINNMLKHEQINVMNIDKVKNDEKKGLSESFNQITFTLSEKTDDIYIRRLIINVLAPKLLKTKVGKNLNIITHAKYDCEDPVNNRIYHFAY